MGYKFSSDYDEYVAYCSVVMMAMMVKIFFIVITICNDEYDHQNSGGCK